MIHVEQRACVCVRAKKIETNRVKMQKNRRISFSGDSRQPAFFVDRFRNLDPHGLAIMDYAYKIYYLR